MKKIALIVILLSMAGGGALMMLGNVDQKTSLSAVLEVWGDLLRDADEVTLQATRISAQQEMAFGQKMSRQMPPDEPADTAYVTAVASLLTPHVRRSDIRYQFHVIPGPEVNAFAVPGGHIYVFTGLLAFVNSEAELAAVLGHEISHVDLRHCIARYQYELAARRVGLESVGQLADLARLPLAISYQKNQELEADAQGVRLAIQAGYDPSAAAALFGRMQVASGTAPAARAKTPQGEILRTMAGGLTDYFRSHPADSDRVARLQHLVESNRSTLQGRGYYIGVTNLRDRHAWANVEIPGEKKYY